MNINLVPEKGMMYALYIDRVVYKPYSKEELMNDSSLENKLLEMHLFDDEKEYRYIKDRGIECVVDDSFPHDDTYVETAYVQEKVDEETSSSSKKISVINYIQYNEDDLLNFVNYRLKQEVR